MGNRRGVRMTMSGTTKKNTMNEARGSIRQKAPAATQRRGKCKSSTAAAVADSTRSERIEPASEMVRPTRSDDDDMTGSDSPRRTHGGEALSFLIGSRPRCCPEVRGDSIRASPPLGWQSMEMVARSESGAQRCRDSPGEGD